LLAPAMASLCSIQDEQATAQCNRNNIKLAITRTAITPATESTNAVVNIANAQLRSAFAWRQFD